MLDKQVLITTSIILFAIAFVVLIFTVFYYHFANEKGLLGKTYYKKTNKPYLSYMFGICGTIFFVNAVTLLLLGLLS